MFGKSGSMSGQISYLPELSASSTMEILCGIFGVIFMAILRL
jgi:hypothetical protein